MANKANSLGQQKSAAPLCFLLPVICGVGSANMLKLLVGVLVIVLFPGCDSGVRTYDISDITKSETITLVKNQGQGAIYSLSIKGEGRIQGNAEIILILNGAPYKTKRLSGPVDFQWEGDWYSDQAEIRYIPISPINGSLRIKYKFNDLK